jgi:excisionase family DNA binding protein
MNKEQAAKRLGVSVRTLQRYMSAHRIAFEMHKTKTGEEATFNKDEVARFKRELKEGRMTATVSPTITNPSEAVSPTAAAPSTALAIFQTAPPAFFEAAPEIFWKRLADRLASTQQRSTTTTADLAQQITLSEKEAAQLAGLPLSQIRKARHQLKSFKTGAGWRIKRGDLDNYIKKL